jgi:hypothetical protein
MSGPCLRSRRRTRGVPSKILTRSKDDIHSSESSGESRQNRLAYGCVKQVRSTSRGATSVAAQPATSCDLLQHGRRPAETCRSPEPVVASRYAATWPRPIALAPKLPAKSVMKLKLHSHWRIRAPIPSAARSPRPRARRYPATRGRMRLTPRLIGQQSAAADIPSYRHNEDCPMVLTAPIPISIVATMLTLQHAGVAPQQFQASSTLSRRVTNAHA